MILPKVPGPTGTIIGFPVSFTFYPLISPSVESKAIVLTLESPRCYATSSTNLWSRPSTSSALRMGGKFVPSN